MEQNKFNSFQIPFAQTDFHNTKSDLKIVDLIQVGNSSNFGDNKNA